MNGTGKALLTEKDLHSYQQFCVDFVESKPQCALFNPDIIYTDMPAAEIPNYPTGFGEITMEGMFDFEYKQDLLDQWEY